MQPRKIASLTRAEYGSAAGFAGYAKAPGGHGRLSLVEVDKQSDVSFKFTPECSPESSDLSDFLKLILEGTPKLSILSCSIRFLLILSSIMSSMPVLVDHSR